MALFLEVIAINPDIPPPAGARWFGLIAASTGPLHIAAATGIHTLGLYVQRWQLRPERYGPVGKRASVLDQIGSWTKIDH